MIFLHFCLTYFLIVNKSNANEIIKRSYKIPAFILIYSPYCSHCKTVHPIWSDLMKKYETDPNILIGECNAVEYEKECKKLFSFHGYPYFIVITNGESKSISQQRTIESFIEEVEKLKMLNYSTSCSVFQSDFNEKFPAFVLTNNDSNDKKCNTLQKIIEIHPQLSKYLYLNATRSSNESFVALTSINDSISFKNLSDIQSMVNFMTEIILQPFASWNYSEASMGKKRIGLLIHQTEQEFESFNSIIKPFYDNYSLCKMYSSTFVQIFPNFTFKKNLLPAFAISNSRKSKFLVLVNVLKNPKKYRLFKYAADGKLEDKAKYDLSALFPIPEGINDDEIEIKLKSTKMPSKLATTNFKIILCFAFILTFCAVFFILWFINKNGNKIE